MQVWLKQLNNSRLINKPTDKGNFFLQKYFMVPLSLHKDLSTSSTTGGPSQGKVLHSKPYLSKITGLLTSKRRLLNVACQK